MTEKIPYVYAVEEKAVPFKRKKRDFYRIEPQYMKVTAHHRAFEDNTFLRHNPCFAYGRRPAHHWLVPKRAVVLVKHIEPGYYSSFGVTLGLDRYEMEKILNKYQWKKLSAADKLTLKVEYDEGLIVVSFNHGYNTSVVVYR